MPRTPVGACHHLNLLFFDPGPFSRVASVLTCQGQHVAMHPTNRRQPCCRLFIAGFGSSMVFGTIVGGLADKG